MIEEGGYVDDCVSAFPSVTPVCAASIATGAGPEGAQIPSMNWWHRGEERYVEYGTSFGASRAFGIRQRLTDTIYNMNLKHLSRDVETVFERLDDGGEVRTAGTTYLMYRGRHRHEPAVDTALTRLAQRLRPSRPGGRRSSSTPTCSRPSRRPAARSSACRGCATSTAAASAEFLVEHDLFDFLLLSLPDNDTHSHKYGPFAQIDSLAAADLPDRAHDGGLPGGIDAFLEDHAVIVCWDHSQSKVEAEIDLFDAFDGFGVLPARAHAAWTTRSRSARTRARPRSTCSTATSDASWCRGSSARCSRSTASTS